MSVFSGFGSDFILNQQDRTHGLLEPPYPAYTNVTVRRAFIVWMYLGQKNKFKQVANYYHCLEAMEENMSPETRALSRHHEFDLFSNLPPVSPFLIQLFPNFYSFEPLNRQYVQKLEAIKNEECVFNLEGFTEMRNKGVTTTDIVHTSQLIRKYCKIHQISLRNFLTEFRINAERCGVRNSIAGIASYIQTKLVEDELDISLEKCPADLSFLDDDDFAYPVVPKVKSEVEPDKNKPVLILRNLERVDEESEDGDESPSLNNNLNSNEHPRARSKNKKKYSTAQMLEKHVEVMRNL